LHGFLKNERQKSPARLYFAPSLLQPQHGVCYLFSSETLWSANKEMAMPVQVNAETCTGCKSCEEVCPTDSIKVNGKNVAETKAEDCIDCNACIDACTTHSITTAE
jgi:Fe-S-cluster-containing hydrogenase component 2